MIIANLVTDDIYTKHGYYVSYYVIINLKINYRLLHNSKIRPISDRGENNEYTFSKN